MIKIRSRGRRKRGMQTRESTSWRERRGRVMMKGGRRGQEKVESLRQEIARGSGLNMSLLNECCRSCQWLEVLRGAVALRTLDH